jgi:excisionase family DNA binding protein
VTAEYSPDVYRLATSTQLAEKKLTVAEVAKILGVSRMTVYRLVTPTDGLPSLLPHYRYKRGKQRQIRIPLSAVRAYLGEAEMGGEW